MTPTVSIIIPSLNAASVAATIDSLRHQTQRHLIREILVVGLDRQRVVRQDELVRFISTGRPVCAAAARNCGIQAATGEWLAFIDSDAIAAPNWLECLLMESQRYKVIGGSVEIESDNYWTYADNLAMFHAQVPSAPAGERRALPTINLLVHRSVIDQIGLMDERFAGAAGEDFDWALRIHAAGFKLRFVPAANVLHRPARSSLRTLLRHSWKSGYNMSIVRQRFPAYYPAAGLLRHPVLLQSLAPLIALAASARIMLARPARRLLRLWPAVALAKMAWCLGAALQAASPRPAACAATPSPPMVH